MTFGLLAWLLLVFDDDEYSCFVLVCFPPRFWLQWLLLLVTFDALSSPVSPVWGTLSHDFKSHLFFLMHSLVTHLSVSNPLLLCSIDVTLASSHFMYQLAQHQAMCLLVLRTKNSFVAEEPHEISIFIHTHSTQRSQLGEVGQRACGDTAAE